MGQLAQSATPLGNEAAEEAAVYGVRIAGVPRLPPSCASCGGAAGQGRVLRCPEKGDERSVIVPYCAGCLKPLEVDKTRDLALALGACLIGVTTAATLPLLWQSIDRLTHAAISVLAAALPVLLGRLAKRSRAAVWWQRPDHLACIRRQWAEQLAELNSESVQTFEALPRMHQPPWVWVGAGLSAMTALWLYDWHQPRLLILNTSGERLHIQIDDRPAHAVASTRFESPSVAWSLRLVAGEHVLRVSADGDDLREEITVRLQGNTDHLYAPLSSETCFWIERANFGRSHPMEPASVVRVLSGERRFWTLTEPIDIWFSPVPQSSDTDRRSSGGQLLALRQALCDEAPTGVRRDDR